MLGCSTDVKKIRCKVKFSLNDKKTKTHLKKISYVPGTVKDADRLRTCHVGDVDISIDEQTVSSTGMY